MEQLEWCDRMWIRLFVRWFRTTSWWQHRSEDVSTNLSWIQVCNFMRMRWILTNYWMPAIDFRYSRRKCYGPDKKYEACTPKQVRVRSKLRLNLDELTNFVLAFSATTSHASRYPSSGIKYVNERRNSTAIFWSRVYRSSAKIRKNRARYFVRPRRAHQSLKVGHIRTALCAGIMNRTKKIIIFV